MDLSRLWAIWAYSKTYSFYKYIEIYIIFEWLHKKVLELYVEFLILNYEGHSNK